MLRQFMYGEIANIALTSLMKASIQLQRHHLSRLMKVGGIDKATHLAQHQHSKMNGAHPRTISYVQYMQQWETHNLYTKRHTLVSGRIRLRSTSGDCDS